ncbi:MAG: VWA domain-containing protein, partial [Pyrinomonadaceae bacterium]|nr:VWA domain-containing protein [Pyrinomonadaceae bacterium]
MNKPDHKHKVDSKVKASGPGPAQPPEKALRERLRSIGDAAERRTLAGLMRELSRLPADRARVALEMSATLASLNLRVGLEFLRAATQAARIFETDELRQWSEMGRRLAMADVETGAHFFASGVQELAEVPREARLLLFDVCARQMALSTSIAVETFQRAPALANVVGDAHLLRSIFEVALAIARRSAKHSADFLAQTPATVSRLQDFGAVQTEVSEAAVQLAAAFAVRAGGVAADMWEASPNSLRALSHEAALELFRQTEKFLERGGAAALSIFTVGGEVLRLVPEAFKDWIHLLEQVAQHSNTNLISLARTSPFVFQALAGNYHHNRAAELAARITRMACEVARVDQEAAIACFRSGPAALRIASIEQFEQWARRGLTLSKGDARVRRSYYALETRQSNDALRSGEGTGLALETITGTLRFYVEALTGRTVEIAPLTAVPTETRINDGRTIHLPSVVGEFTDEALNFRLYKVLAAHAAGQIEFGTHEQDTSDLRAAYQQLNELYALENVDALDAFALNGYINTMAEGERALAPEEEARLAAKRRRRLPPDSDYRQVLALFPRVDLATRIFGTLENGRIDRRLRHAYRGLQRDLDLVREHVRQNRPRIAELPVTIVPFELLFQITLCGGAKDDARSFYGQTVSELEGIVADYLTDPAATVADTLMATSRIYSLFQSTSPDQSQQQETVEQKSISGENQTDSASDVEASQSESLSSPQQPLHDARELFNAWAGVDDIESESDELDLDKAERWTQVEVPEQRLQPGETAFSYDEWDRELNDSRIDWCRVIEKRVRRGDRSFVELTRTRYRGVISSIRHQFQMMKPESLRRVANELDGDDYDLNALVDYITDRRADGQQSERIYTKRLRRERDTTVAFLLDQSSSTARTIGRHPLQPYTHPGRRIIEIEKEGLVLMSEALEAVGDRYAIYGFTSEGRRNVKFYVVKDFDERYSEEIERRIGGITYQHNTRLGAAVRHTTRRLMQQEARTRLLIVLSDGRPYDHDYGDARYAREDTREALREARRHGVSRFCFTFVRDS